jgi:hypothetical protein
MMTKHNPVAYRLAAAASLAFGVCGLVRAEAGSYAPPVQAAQGQSAKPSPAHAAPAPAPPSAPATAPSLLDHPAQPAKITLNAGKLSVQAHNSVLADILHEVSKESGMKIDGLDAGSAADRRMFGTYGPGTPRDVLSDLLSDSGYNFLMLGNTSSGAPRQLALTARTGGPAGSAPPPNRNTQEQTNPDEPQPVRQPDEPQNYPVPQPGPPENQNRVRSPQQMLQELQRMHEQQQQQQEQQQQQQQQQDQPDQPDQPDQQPEQPD